MRRILSALLLLVLCAAFCTVSADSISVQTAQLTDGQRYLRGYDAASKSYVYVKFGNYMFNSDGSFAPCVWRVLAIEDDAAYLLNEWVVDWQPFHSRKKDLPRDWLDYELCEWVNTVMINTMFTPQEQAVMRDSESTRKLFILGNEDWVKTSYGFKNWLIKPQPQRCCKPTPYCKAKGCYVNEKNYCTWYWSATSRHTAAGGYERIIGFDGHISMHGYPSEGGIRPACRVECSMLDHKTGSGTLDDPYVFQIVN